VSEQPTPLTADEPLTYDEEPAFYRWDDGLRDYLGRVRAYRELLALRTQLEQAQRQKTFPHTTPTGHTYHEPTDWKQLCEWSMNRAQGWIECWDDEELPPDETPAMFTIAWNTAVRAREALEAAEARETALLEALELAKDWGCFGPGMTIDGFTAKHGNVSKEQMAQIVARALSGEGSNQNG
jgi:hypothetical protein